MANNANSNTKATISKQLTNECHSCGKTAINMSILHSSTCPLGGSINNINKPQQLITVNQHGMTGYGYIPTSTFIALPRNLPNSQKLVKVDQHNMEGYKYM